MKICFTSDEKNGLESVMSYHFGRCPYYVIVDMEENEVKSVKSMPNPMVEGHNPGDLPSYMKSQDVDVIITGGMGPKAQQYFEDYGIKCVTGAYGKVKEVLEEFLKSKISVKKEELKVEEQTINKEESETDRLKKEITDLRRQIAELKSRLTKLEEKNG